MKIILFVVLFGLYFFSSEMSQSVKVDVNISKGNLVSEYFKITGKVKTFCYTTCHAVLRSICSQHNINFKFVLAEKTIPPLKSYLKKLMSKHSKTRKKGGKQFKQLMETWEKDSYALKVYVSELCYPEMHCELNKERKGKRDLFLKYLKQKKKTQILQNQMVKLKRKYKKICCRLTGVQLNKSVRPLRQANNRLLSKSQRCKRKRGVTEECRQSLTFLQRYGLDAVSVNVKQEKTGERMTLGLDGSLEDHKENISHVNLDSLIFVKDSENISNRTYHELSMIVPTLPRSNAVQNRIKELNSDVTITATPNDSIGVQQSLTARLTRRVTDLISSGRADRILQTKTVHVKLTGDGTDLGRRKKLTNFGFTILDEELCTSVKGNYLLAVFSGNESYDNLKSALQDIISETRSLKYLTIDDVSFRVVFYLGGDLKFLNLICGISSCASTYSCIWCKCPAKDRHDMDQMWSVTSPELGGRTVEEITIMASRKKLNFNCLHPPIFDFIPLERVVPDLLHLYLRISDQLASHI